MRFLIKCKSVFISFLSAHYFFGNKSVKKVISVNVSDGDFVCADINGIVIY